MSWRQLASAGLLVLVDLVCACSRLPDIPEGTCGNGVNDEGEDCDPHGASTFCGPPGTPAACRWLCASMPCPTGWTCDQSAGICRHGNGRFSRGTTTQLLTDGVLTGDVDGDSRADVVAWNGERVHLLFGDGRGGFAETVVVALPGRTGPPVLGKLTDDGSESLVVPSASGLLAFAGGRDRSPSPLVPTQYASSDFRLALPMRVGAIEPASRGTQVLIIGATTMRFGPPAPQVTELEASLPHSVPAAAIRRPPVVGDVDDDGIDELVIAFPGDREMFLYRLIGVPIGETRHARPVLAQTIALPAPVDEGARLVDLDGDGVLDITVSALGGVMAAMNQGDGTFAEAAFSELFDRNGGLDGCAGVDPWPLAVGTLHTPRSLRRSGQLPPQIAPLSP